MLTGFLSKIAVLQRVLAKVLFPLFAFIDTSVGHPREHFSEHPDFGERPREHSRELFGVLPFSTSLPGQDVP